MSEELEQWVEEMLKINDAEEKMTEKQVQILKAAIETFAEKGYAASSTSEIAQKAGVAEGTIFRHYKTKKELLFSIIAPMVAKLVAPFVLKEFNKVLDTPFDRFEDLLRAIIRDRIGFLQKNKKVIQIFLQEIPFHPELREQYIQVVSKEVITRAQKIVQHYQQKQQVIDIPPMSAIRLTASTLIGYVASDALFGSHVNWDRELELEQTIQFIMRGLGTERIN